MRTGGPRRESLDNTQYGIHYAIVCQNKDPEKLERIKVRLPWLDGGEEDQTFWAQLLTPMEGRVAKVMARFPVVTFFGGKVVFARERWYQRLLHNETAMAIQKRLYWLGATMVILPAKVS